MRVEPEGRRPGAARQSLRESAAAEAGRGDVSHPPARAVSHKAPCAAAQLRRHATLSTLTVLCLIAVIALVVTTVAAAQGDAGDGQALFESAGCGNCHTVDGGESVGPTMLGLAGSQFELTDGETVTADQAYLLTAIAEPDAQVVAGFQPGIMSAAVPPGSIPQGEAEDMVAYIQTLAQDGGSPSPEASPMQTGSPSASPTASSGPTGEPSPTATASPLPGTDEGSRLFADNCAGCHGPEGRGGGVGPSLRAAAFEEIVAPMVRAGGDGMPAFEKRLTDAQIDAVSRTVATEIADPEARKATVAEGGVTFRLYCAGCHSTSGVGGAMAGGKNAPALQDIPAANALSAMLRGPGNMPEFVAALDVRQRAAVSRYVNLLQEPPSPGGLGLGWIGPVAEGAVAMLAVVGLVLIGIWLAWRKGGVEE